MPRVIFTPNLAKHIDCPEIEAPGESLREVLETVFALNPRARSYVLDDQGAVRYHVVIFINGEPIADRLNLSDPVLSDAEIYVAQALSGG